MRMRQIAALVMLGLGGCSANVARSTGSEMPLTAVVCVVGPVPSLTFELTNKSGSPLRIEGATLPWVWWYGSKVQITDSATFKSIEQVFPLEDPPPPRPLVIEPGERVSGVVELTTYFPSLAAHSEENALDVNVQWGVTGHAKEPLILEAAMSLPAAFFEGKNRRCVQEFGY
jgi:hypothetical protein